MALASRWLCYHNKIFKYLSNIKLLLTYHCLIMVHALVHCDNRPYCLKLWSWLYFFPAFFIPGHSMRPRTIQDQHLLVDSCAIYNLWCQREFWWQLMTYCILYILLYTIVINMAGKKFTWKISPLTGIFLGGGKGGILPPWKWFCPLWIIL